MFVAISQRNDKNKHGLWIDNLENNYVKFFEKYNINLIPIPNVSKNVEIYFEKYNFSGIILSGGNDVNPKLYGEKLTEELSVSIQRDKIENKLIKIAIEKDIPMLGICKGMQHLNVFFKGKLLKDIKKELGEKIDHVHNNHKIKITDKKTKKILGQQSIVNSYHGQGLNTDFISSELKTFAEAEDEIIEGFYHENLPLAGIQWHPERKSPDENINSKIIEMFIKKEFFWKI